jgi:ribosomal protein S18 acetylase RimI-like enzyme
LRYRSILNENRLANPRLQRTALAPPLNRQFGRPPHITSGTNMHEQADLADITFTENGDVDASQLNALYRLIGWDRANRRTAAETSEMLKASRYYIAAQTAEGVLIGFSRVCGDPYVAQVLDVITHPEYRHRGVATTCMRGVLGHLQRSRYVSVTLNHGSGLEGFYQRFGFQVFDDATRIWNSGTETTLDDLEGSLPNPPSQRP